MTTSPFDSDRGLPDPRRDRRKKRRGARRGDPNAVVPDAQPVRVDERGYYGSNVVKPPPWEHHIADYLFLGGLSAGSALIGAGAAATGRTRLRRRARIASLVAVGLGGNALIADLGRPERFLNMMRTAKLTSPMSVGSWILAAFSVTTGGATALEILRDPAEPTTALRRATHLDGDALAPWLKGADGLMTAGSAFFAPPLAAYTAVLLADTATPLWHESYRELPFLFVSSATAAGSGLSMIIAPTEETDPVRALAVLGGVGDLAADEVLRRRLGEEGRPLHEGRAGRFHRAAQVLTAVGTVGAAVAGRRRSVNVLAGACLMAGSACTRYAFYHAGMESARDPQYTIRPQKARVEAKRAQGRAVTQPGGQWPDRSGL